MAELADALDSGSSRGNSVEVQVLLAAMYKYLLVSLFFIGNVFSISVSSQDAHKIAEKIWKNECSSTMEKLTHWGKNENFPSLGIGHFIWYPAGKEDRFQETFPALLTYLEKEGAVLPPWLKTSRQCPWNSREEFYSQINSPQMKELRQFLFDTKNLQALFIAARLEKALPRITEKLTSSEKEKVTKAFSQLASNPQGLYALIDYTNFKGEGISPTETYKGKGWGLLQVLQAMEKNTVAEFVIAAKKILAQRVKNSPPEREEEKWLKGWFNRLDTYLY
jgi:hypothetical protein